MAFDPAQSLNNYNVYQSGQNGADNRTNQNNQLSGRLQLSNQNHPPKARACNNKNIDGAKSKGFKLGKLVRQTTIKVAYSQNNKSKFFYEAVKNGDVKRVKKWLEAGAEVNYVNGKGITPLCRAAWKGYTDVVKLLLSHPEIDVNKDRPLYWAAKNGHIEIVKLLLSHPEIDVNQANNIGFTPLYWAAKEGHIEIVKLLLSHPEIDVNQADYWGQTTLYWAAREGHIKIVKLLLSHPNSCDKIDVNHADNDGWTLLLWAARNGHVDVVNALLSHPETDVNLANGRGETLINWAAKNGHIEIVKLLLSHPEIDVNQANNIGFTPLYWAAKKSRVDIINALLSDPKINMNEDVREYLDRLVANNDVDTIQEIVLNGCSKEVYEYLHTKAIEAGKEHLIERLSHLFTGYANMEALGGHYKAYNAEVDVPEDLLNIVKEYLNPNLPKQTNVSDTQKRTCIRKSLQTYISASIYKLFGL